ncbi:MAG: SUMF1/EgtB/PvdO family nonheme iron enzyme, partial [Magnetococcus sp. YQC-5]
KFSEPGSGFTKNGTATLYFKYPDGKENTLKVNILSDGTYSNIWPSSTSSAIGTYQYWAVDDVTGIKSNTVSFVVTAVGLTTTSGSVSAISAGNGYTVALRNGTAWAWGKNDYGQLGDGTGISRSSPVQVSGITDITAISSGAYHTLALKNDGTVWAWGNNTSGELGDGSQINRLSPVQISGLTGITAISSSYNDNQSEHSLALKNDGTVWAWGNNQYGQLGDGFNNNRSMPYKITRLSDIVAISAGTDYTVALKRNGSVLTFGSNYFGQLGNGTTINSSIPVQVSGLTGISAISAGYKSTLALKNDGTVWSWGLNQYGQLGDDSNIDRSTPVQVSGLTGISSILTVHNNSLALKNDGTVWAWGYNEGGQLGDGSTISRSTPVQVSGLTGITNIFVGKGYPIALKNDGTLWAWGYNKDGRFDDGTQENHLTPIKINFDFSSTATTSVPAPDFTNSLGMKFKRISSGTFMMGSPSTEKNRNDDEGPQHSVTISKPFYMQMTEITQGQWKAVMGTNPSSNVGCGDNCPVEQVSWYDVQTFITKLNAKGEGFFRLPTEAEWEYAARAGTTTAYSFGDDSSKSDDYVWSRSYPVATKLPNPWGLYDMHGNVDEWVSDWYGSYANTSMTDPSGPLTGSKRVVRDNRSAARTSQAQTDKSSTLGLRLAIDPVSISSIPSQIIKPNTTSGAIAFTVKNIENTSDTFTLSGTSSDKKLIPDANIIFGGSGTDRTMTITAGNSGFVTISVQANSKDGKVGNTSFKVIIASCTTGYCDNNDGTITDIKNGLIGLKNANCFDKQTWDAAMSKVATLASGTCGLKDGSSAGQWRLLTKDELPIYMDWQQSNAFVGAQSDYWSSTTTASLSIAWFLHHYYGIVYSNYEWSTYYVWPVRGGQ